MQNKVLLLMTSLLLSFYAQAQNLTCNSKSPCRCPDMSKFDGTIPSNWHARFDQTPPKNTSNQLQIIILEMIDKKQYHNFYCRYINDKNETFLVSTPIQTPSRIKPTHSQYWHYDKKDNVWECDPKSQDTKERLSQCEFIFD